MAPKGQETPVFPSAVKPPAAQAARHTVTPRNARSYVRPWALTLLQKLQTMLVCGQDLMQSAPRG